MGHQFSYYMTPKDTKDIEQRLRSKIPFAVILRRSPSASPRVIDSLLFEEQGNCWTGFMALARPEDLERVVMRHVPTQGYWSVEVLESPVIEFGRCFFDGATIVLDRVYYVDGFYDKDGIWVEKSPEFKAFAKKVFSITKRALMRHGDDYIGPDAQAWADAGGTLVQMKSPQRTVTVPARVPPRR